MSTITWFAATAADTAMSANVADDWIAAINTLVNNNSASGSWEVAQYNSGTPKSVLLRRKSLAAGRVVIFGQQGQTANAASVYGAGISANQLYVGYSPTSTSNTVSSWTAGAALADSDFSKGIVICPLNANTVHLGYFDCSDGIVIVGGISGTGFVAFGAGALVESLSSPGTYYETIWAGGATYATTWLANSAAAGSLFNPAITTDTYSGPTNPAHVVRISGGWRLAFRPLSATASNFGSAIAIDNATLRAWFLPIHICGSTTFADGVYGKMRQIAMGPYCVRDTAWLDSVSGNPIAYGVSYTVGVSNASLWLLNSVV